EGEGAGLDAGFCLLGRPGGHSGEQMDPATLRVPAGVASGGALQRPCGLALYAVDRFAAGDPDRVAPAFRAGIESLAREATGQHAAAASFPGAVRSGTAADDPGHSGALGLRLRGRLRRAATDPDTDRPRLARPGRATDHPETVAGRSRAVQPA